MRTGGARRASDAYRGGDDRHPPENGHPQLLQVYTGFMPVGSGMLGLPLWYSHRTCDATAGEDSSSDATAAKSSQLRARLTVARCGFGVNGFEEYGWKGQRRKSDKAKNLWHREAKDDLA
jgi:hypothetical protein